MNRKFYLIVWHLVNWQIHCGGHCVCVCWCGCVCVIFAIRRSLSLFLLPCLLLWLLTAFIWCFAHSFNIVFVYFGIKCHYSSLWSLPSIHDAFHHIFGALFGPHKSHKSEMKSKKPTMHFTGYWNYRNYFMLRIIEYISLDIQFVTENIGGISGVLLFEPHSDIAYISSSDISWAISESNCWSF